MSVHRNDGVDSTTFISGGVTRLWGCQLRLVYGWLVCDVFLSVLDGREVIRGLPRLFTFPCNVNGRTRVFFHLFRTILLYNGFVSNSSMLLYGSCILVRSCLPTYPTSDLTVLSTVDQSFMSNIVFLLVVFSTVSRRETTAYIFESSETSLHSLSVYLTT